MRWSVKSVTRKKMWAEILTKPEQGATFQWDTKMLMNVPIDYDDELEKRNAHPHLLPKLGKEMSKWMKSILVFESNFVFDIKYRVLILVLSRVMTSDFRSRW